MTTETVRLDALVGQLRALGEAGYAYAGEAADAIDRACKRSEFWKANHLAGNVEIERLRAALTVIASFREGSVVNSSFDEPESARIARSALAPNNQAQLRE